MVVLVVDVMLNLMGIRQRLRRTYHEPVIFVAIIAIRTKPSNETTTGADPDICHGRRLGTASLFAVATRY